MGSLQSIARALGGEVTGRGILCPGPGHSKHDRSLSVTIDPNAQDGFLVHSFAGDDWQECRDHVKVLLGISDGYRSISKPNRNIVTLPGTAKNTDFARQIWEQSIGYLGTPAANYLKARDLTPIETDALRYHTNCPFKGERVCAMVAAMVDIQTNEFRGIHRTRLNPKDKAMLGPSQGAVVKLTADEDVAVSLNICEGIETGIALHNAGVGPVWCCLSAGGMANFPVLHGIEDLTIYADNDANDVGQRSAAECGIRWQDAGKTVQAFTTPTAGTDFADRGDK